MTHRQNPHLTYKGNVGAGRHGWLRLTPAYSVRLVREIVISQPPDIVVTDPFSGTGTTALAAAEHGATGQAFDVNPFLVWLGNTKLRNYRSDDIACAQKLLASVVLDAQDMLQSPELWQPDIFKIERWWSASALAALKALRGAIDLTGDGPARDLLEIALCRVLIGASNASFSHQSMSIKSRAGEGPFAKDEATAILSRYRTEALEVIDIASVDLPGTGRIIEADSRALKSPAGQPACDLLLTSPPYVNRMSYIRELRPYMYWTRHLKDASAAGDLDWRAIGGTWGVATSRLNGWTSQEDIPVTPEMNVMCEAIQRDGGKSGSLLSAYVRKYFDDMWSHFQSAFKHVRSGGTATYIVGNSTFYGHVVPAEKWYAAMLQEAGFVNVTVTTIRKRNSNKNLFEFNVTATRP